MSFLPSRLSEKINDPLFSIVGKMHLKRDKKKMISFVFEINCIFPVQFEKFIGPTQKENVSQSKLRFSWVFRFRECTEVTKT